MQRQNNWRRHSGRGNNSRSGGNRGGRGRQSNISNTNKNPLRQQMDSNGPLGRVRGNAMQIMDKYIILAKEATSDGDRVLAEACLQYAEHYQRLIIEHQGQFKPSEEDMNGEGYSDMEQPESMPRRSSSARPSNGDGVRIMGRGVVRYLDDDNDAGDHAMGDDGDKEGEDLPSFLTGSQRANGKRKMNDDGAE